jgi:hypothetical protein
MDMLLLSLLLLLVMCGSSHVRWEGHAIKTYQGHWASSLHAFGRNVVHCNQVRMGPSLESDLYSLVSSQACCAHLHLLQRLLHAQ